MHVARGGTAQALAKGLGYVVVDLFAQVTHHRLFGVVVGGRVYICITKRSSVELHRYSAVGIRPIAIDAKLIVERKRWKFEKSIEVERQRGVGSGGEAQWVETLPRIEMRITRIFATQMFVLLRSVCTHNIESRWLIDNN